jgi:sirohydrochlorin cobaltochelatase
MSDGVLIAAHGSRDPAGVAEFWALARAWQNLRPDRLQAAGFLEFERPTIGEAIDDLVARGARQVTVVPAMLMAAGHVKNDVPSEVQEAGGRHPGVAFRMARPLEIHPGLLELCHDRYRESLARRAEIPAARTLLLLVGRGTSDPDANASIAALSRFLWEAYGVGWAAVAYAGGTAPGVDDALQVCRRMGFPRVVVQPYFLFDGVLLKRIYETVARHAAEESAVEFVPVGHLRQGPLLLGALEDRAHEAAHGSPNMNCQLCKYRVRLLGHENDAGEPQYGHHHHARAAHENDHRETPLLRLLLGSALVPDLASHAWDQRLLERLDLAR